MKKLFWTFALLLFASQSFAKTEFLCSTQLLNMPSLKISVSDAGEYSFYGLLEKDQAYVSIPFTESVSGFDLDIPSEDRNLADARVNVNSEIEGYLRRIGRSHWDYEVYASELYTVTLPNSGARSDSRCRMVKL